MAPKCFFQWDTVCDRAYMISTSQTILVVGVMIGAMTMATLSDYVGRKRVMLWSVIVISILGFCVGWVKHFWLFCLLRFLIGVVQQVSGDTVYPQNQLLSWWELRRHQYHHGVIIMTIPSVTSDDRVGITRVTCWEYILYMYTDYIMGNVAFI